VGREETTHLTVFNYSVSALGGSGKSGKRSHCLLQPGVLAAQAAQLGIAGALWPFHPLQPVVIGRVCDAKNTGNLMDPLAFASAIWSFSAISDSVKD
jgi:hypothetical protein